MEPVRVTVIGSSGIAYSKKTNAETYGDFITTSPFNRLPYSLILLPAKDPNKTIIIMNPISKINNTSGTYYFASNEDAVLNYLRSQKRSKADFNNTTGDESELSNQHPTHGMLARIFAGARIFTGVLTALRARIAGIIPSSFRSLITGKGKGSTGADSGVELTRVSNPTDKSNKFIGNGYNNLTTKIPYSPKPNSDLDKNTDVYHHDSQNTPKP